MGEDTLALCEVCYAPVRAGLRVCGGLSPCLEELTRRESRRRRRAAVRGAIKALDVAGGVAVLFVSFVAASVLFGMVVRIAIVGARFGWGLL